MKKNHQECQETLSFPGVLLSASIFEGVASETVVLKLCAWGTLDVANSLAHRSNSCPTPSLKHQCHLATVPTRISSTTQASRSKFSSSNSLVKAPQGQGSWRALGFAGLALHGGLCKYACFPGGTFMVTSDCRKKPTRGPLRWKELGSTVHRMLHSGVNFAKTGPLPSSSQNSSNLVQICSPRAHPSGSHSSPGPARDED